LNKIATISWLHELGVKALFTVEEDFPKSSLENDPVDSDRHILACSACLHKGTDYHVKFLALAECPRTNIYDLSPPGYLKELLESCWDKGLSVASDLYG